MDAESVKPQQPMAHLSFRLLIFQNKMRVMALKTTNNIHLLIKDLFHNPPSYKATILLSWKPIVRILIRLSRALLVLKTKLLTDLFSLQQKSAAANNANGSTVTSPG